MPSASTARGRAFSNDDDDDEQGDDDDDDRRAGEGLRTLEKDRAWVQWKENVAERVQEGGTVQAEGREQDQVPDI